MYLKVPEVPPKAISVKISAPLIRSDLHSSESDSPRSTILSSNKNTGDSILSSSKSAINVVPKKEVPKSKAMISCDQKRTIFRPVRHKDVNCNL